MRRLLMVGGLVVAMLFAVTLQAQMRGASSGRPAFAPRGSSFGGRGFGSTHFGPRFGGGFGHFGGGFGHGFRGGFGGGFHSHFGSGFRFYGAFGYPYRGFYGGFGYPWYGSYAYPVYSYPLYSYPAYSYPVVLYSDRYDSGRYDSDLDYSYQQKRNMEELDRLEDRVSKLEDQRASANVPRPPQYEAQTRSSTPIVLIFRDRHTQEAENYAIVGQTIWLFNEQRAKRVPMSEIDIAATQRANLERGIDLHLDSRPMDRY